MRLGIMQPYFFPYLGYYELIARTDRWIVFDVVKYAARSWMNRNRILHPQTGWQYVSIPVHNDSHLALIKDTRLVDKTLAETKILAQLLHYRRRAPHYDQVTALVRETFHRAPDDTLTQVNLASLATVCEYLQIPFKWDVCSELDLDFSNVEHPGQWALHICSQLGASGYLNPPGGRAIFRPEEWSARGIELAFTDPPPLVYQCAPYSFVENLSILDVMMWVPPETILKTLMAAKDHANRQPE